VVRTEVLKYLDDLRQFSQQTFKLLPACATELQAKVTQGLNDIQQRKTAVF
jgi:hypothetical protein